MGVSERKVFQMWWEAVWSNECLHLVVWTRSVITNAQTTSLASGYLHFLPTRALDIIIWPYLFRVSSTHLGLLLQPAAGSLPHIPPGRPSPLVFCLSHGTWAATCHTLGFGVGSAPLNPHSRPGVQRAYVTLVHLGRMKCRAAWRVCDLLWLVWYPTGNFQ